MVCPGSRSGPLALAFACQERIGVLPVLDERSACFFALGIARRSRTPVAVLVTSGTAVANLRPAVTEAFYACVPLILLTADRPPELRQCSAGQTIDHRDALHGVCRSFIELPVPEISLLHHGMAAVRQSIATSGGAPSGPVQINIPFREPLYPESLDAYRPPATSARPIEMPLAKVARTVSGEVSRWIEQARAPIVLFGVLDQTVSLGIARNAESDWVFADVLSAVRHHGTDVPFRVFGCYDQWLRVMPEPSVDLFILVGRLPTSKVLRQWLESSRVRTLVIDEPAEDRPLPSANPWIRVDPAVFVSGRLRLPRSASLAGSIGEVQKACAEGCTVPELQLPGILARSLPEASEVMIASSTPIRDAEWFWPPTSKRFQVWSNRGANGIDGTIATALGIASESRAPCYLVIGDLAFLHDQNALLISPSFQGSLTIIIVDNHGGGIFENLPVRRFSESFERFFATPQTIDFSKLMAAYNIPFQEVQAAELATLLGIEIEGVRVLLMRSDRREAAEARKLALGFGVRLSG